MIKNRQAETYNKLYSLLRSRLSSRDLSFQLNAFFDGSAAIMVTVSKNNAQVTLSMLVTPEFDTDDNLIRWRVIEEDRVVRIQTLDQIQNRLGTIIQNTRIILSKIG